jgi:biopolymer transport protein ExbD
MRLPQTARSSELGLQMTAMIDVVFLLLVFFLWTSSFEKPEFDLRSSLALPPSGNSASLSKEAPLPFDEIVVRIIGSNGENELRVNEMPVADFAHRVAWRTTGGHCSPRPERPDGTSHQGLRCCEGDRIRPCVIHRCEVDKVFF